MLGSLSGTRCIGKNGEAEQSGQNDDERHEHLERRADDRRHFRGAQILGGQHPLHDEKVGRPVAHGQDRAEAENDAGPVHAHGVVTGLPITRHMWV